MKQVLAGIAVTLTFAATATLAADPVPAGPAAPAPASGAPPSGPPIVAPASTAGGIAALTWMAGCWEATGGGGKVTFHEMWMAPAGGVMIGGGRTIAAGRTVFTEHLEIREDADGVAYRARPQDAPAVVPFKLTKQGEGSVVFENPGHDFPTRILYEKLPEGGLRARVEGPAGAKEKAQEFVYRRIHCE